MDTRDGVVAWSPVLGTRDLPLAAGLNRRLGKPVLIENDASAMAFAIAQRHPVLRSGRTACLMIGDGVGLGFLVQGELYRGARSGGSEFGHVRLRRSGPQCRCGGRGCIEAFLADYALHRDAQLIDHRPAPTALMPSEDAMSTHRRAGAGGRSGARSTCFGRPARCWATPRASSSRPSSRIISSSAARARGPWTSCGPSFEAALELQTIPELRALATIHVVESSMDILTDGVVMQALRELDLDLARLKAA